LMVCFMLAAQSAKADDIIFNDLGDTIRVSPSSSPVLIVLGCQKIGAANSDFCNVILSRAGQTITGVSGGNFVLNSNSTYTLAEDPAKTLLSDTFTSTVLSGSAPFFPGSATFTFLSDPKAEAIRRYDLVHAGAGEGGRDIARPAEFLVDSTGTVRWVNLTENYWVRARPEQILEAAKALR